MAELNFRGVKRVNEAVHPDFLDVTEVQELVNFVLDRQGKEMTPCLRGAFISFNSNPANNSDVLGLEDISDEAGNDFLMATCGDKLLQSQGGRTFWATKIDNTYPNKPFHFIPIGNGTYIASNGFDRPYILSGSYFTNVNPLIIPRPEVEQTTILRVPFEGLSANSLYRWLWVYVTENGEISEVSKEMTSFALISGEDYYQDLYTTDNTYKRFQFNNVPVSSDLRVTGKRLYRTKANSRVFYLAAAIDNTVETYVDSLPDDELDVTEVISYLGIPLSMKFMAYHRGRVFGANITKDYHNAILPPAKSNAYFRPVDAGVVTNLADGQYQVAISYTDSDGRESELSPFGLCDMDYLGLGIPQGRGKVITSGWALPRVGAGGLNKDIVSINLYRTKLNQAGPYYYIMTKGVTEVEVNPDILTFGESDSSLSQTYPIKSKKYDDVANFKNALIYSDINRPSQFLQENVILVYPDGSDEITGILDDTDGILIFKRYSINKIYTSQGSPVTWHPLRISNTIGCTHPETLVQSSAGKAFFVHNREVWLYETGAFRLLSKAKEKTLSLVNQFRAACYYSFRQWYCLLCTDNSGDFLLCYDEKLDGWYEFRIEQAESNFPNRSAISDVAEKRYGFYANSLLLGRNNYLSSYSENSITDYAPLRSSDINARLTTKVFSFQNEIALSRPRKLRVNYKGSPSSGTTGQVTHRLIDADSQSSRQFTETANLSGTLTRLSVEAMAGSGLETTSRLYYQISGSIQEFISMNLQYNVVNRGMRQ